MINNNFIDIEIVVDSLKKYLKELVDEMTFENLFDDINISIIDNDNIEIKFKSKKVIDVVKKMYFEIIDQGVFQIFNKKINILLSLKNSDSVITTNLVKNKNKATSKITFNDLLESSFNKKPLEAIKIVIENTDVKYNPIFIYSKSGLGKTHVLKALEYTILNDENIIRTIIYLNSNDFVNSIINLLVGKNQKELNKYINQLKDVDILLIDDVQLFSNKTKVLEVFFEIINNRIDNEKQIIICCDKKPKDLGGFEDRLISRFDGGLTLDIKKPSMEELKNIIKFKIKKNNWNLENWTEDGIEYIVKFFSESIRTIEGVLRKIDFLKVKEDKNIIYDEKKIRSFLIGSNSEKSKINYNLIIDIVCKYYKISKNDLISKSRERKLVQARDITMWFLRNFLKMPFSKIGEVFSNRKHSAVIESVKRIENKMEIDITMKNAIKVIQIKIDRN